MKTKISSIGLIFMLSCIMHSLQFFTMPAWIEGVVPAAIMWTTVLIYSVMAAIALISVLADMRFIRHRSAYTQILAIWLLICFIWFLVIFSRGFRPGIISDVFNYTLWPLLGIYSYSLTLRGKFTTSRFVFWVSAQFVILLFCYIFLLFTIGGISTLSSGSRLDIMTLSMSGAMSTRLLYPMIWSLPIIVCYSRRRRFVAIVIVLSIVCAFLSVKRGVIVSLVGVATFLMLYKYQKKYYIRKVLAGLCFVLVASIVSIYNMDLFYKRVVVDFEQGSASSGRIVIWNEMWIGIVERPFHKQFFGSGCGESKIYLEENLGKAVSFSHNDWIDTLYCLGIVGVATYFLLFVALFLGAVKAWKLNSKHTLSLWFLVILLLFPSIYSTTIIARSWLLFISIGHVLALLQLEIRSNKMTIASMRR